MEVRSAIFAVPGSTGDHSFTIGGWGETPKACTIHLIGTDATDGFDNGSIIGFGAIDSAGDEYCVSVSDENGVGTTNNGRLISAFAIARVSFDGQSIPYTAVYSTWETGGVELTFAGTPNSAHQLLITFYAGADLSSKTISFLQNAHVESVGFTSKLIFTGCTGMADQNRDINVLTLGVLTNGLNGLTQNYVGYGSPSGDATSSVYSNVGTGLSHAQLFQDAVSWESSIGSIDSDGFTASTPTGADLIMALCMTFDEDVDCGYSTIPTSGDISITDPGFIPQVVGAIISNNTAVDAVKTSGDLIVGMGVVDGSAENSVSIVGEDGVGTTNNTSIHSSSVLHGEDADQSDIFDASLDSFTANGFDLTVNTNPATATYFLWWAIEEEAGELEAACAESASITEAQTVQQDSDVVDAESASISEAQTAIKEISAEVSESASITEAQTIQADLNASVSEALRSYLMDQDGAFILDHNGDKIPTSSFWPKETQTAEEINEASIAESASITEAQTVQSELNDSNSESASINEEQTTQANLNASIAESLGISEAQTAIKEVEASTSESASINEAQAVQAELNDSVSESSSISESQSATEDNEGDVSESASINESQTVQSELNDSVSESASISESQDAQLISYSEITESLSISESQDVQFTAYPDITESLAVSALESASLTSGSSVSESLSISETQTAALTLPGDQKYTVSPQGSGTTVEIIEPDCGITVSGSKYSITQ